MTLTELLALPNEELAKIAAVEVMAWNGVSPQKGIASLVIERSQAYLVRDIAIAPVTVAQVALSLAATLAQKP